MELFYRIFSAFLGIAVLAGFVYLYVWTIKQFTRRK